MSEFEKISFLDGQIALLRLEIIKTIGGINRLLSRDPRATRSQEYLELKNQYQFQKEEMHCLGTLRKGLSC